MCARCVCVHAWGLAQSHWYQPRLQQQLSALLLSPAIAFTLAEALQGVLLLPGLMARCGKERIFLPSVQSPLQVAWKQGKTQSVTPQQGLVGLQELAGKSGILWSLHAAKLQRGAAGDRALGISQGTMQKC